MAQQLNKRRVRFRVCRSPADNLVGQTRVALVDALAQQEGRPEYLRQLADRIRSIGRGGNVRVDVLAAESVVPDGHAVLKNRRGHPGNAGFYPKRFEISLENRKGQTLGRRWLY